MTLQEFATSFSNRKNVKNVGGKKTQGLHPETIKTEQNRRDEKTKKILHHRDAIDIIFRNRFLARAE